MRSQQIGFGEDLAKRPRAAACLKRMRSEEQAVKLMSARALNARQEARELTNPADATQVLAIEVSASHWQIVVQCTRRLALSVSGAGFGLFFVLLETGYPTLQAVNYIAWPSNNPSST
jgi:hypothetical protein